MEANDEESPRINQLLLSNEQLRLKRGSRIYERIERKKQKILDERIPLIEETLEERLEKEVDF